MNDPPKPATPTRRIVSIDILRGLTILLMIFVNDIAGVADTPSWLKHFHPPDGDGMTIVDVVFPAFLFIVGLAIPLALLRRRTAGELTLATVRHVTTRTVSLLVIGILMVNSDNISSEGPLNPNLWTLLMYAGVFLVWVDWRAQGDHQRTIKSRLRLAGVFLILTVAVLYRADDVSGLIQLRPRWWGILGLIGWAYLIATLVYMLARGRTLILLGAACGLFALHIAITCGSLTALDTLGPFTHLSCTLGSHPALVLLGAIAGGVFVPRSTIQSHLRRAASGLLFAGFLAFTGWFLHLRHGTFPCLIINKNLGTVPWCLLSAAITMGALVAVYWLVDRRPQSTHPSTAELAGRNALFAYILAPIIYALVALIADLSGTVSVWSVLSAPFVVGLGRAVGLSLLVMGVAAWLSRRGVHLKI